MSRDRCQEQTQAEAGRTAPRSSPGPAGPRAQPRCQGDMTRGNKRAPCTGGLENEEQAKGHRGEKGRGGLRMGGRGAGRAPLTYLAKKDFCSWGFLAFWACSISRRSMKAAVSGLGAGQGGDRVRGWAQPTRTPAAKAAAGRRQCCACRALHLYPAHPHPGAPAPWGTRTVGHPHPGATAPWGTTPWSSHILGHPHPAVLTLGRWLVAVAAQKC